MNELDALKKATENRYSTVAARFLMRPLSIRITWVLLKTEITPIQVTLLGSALGILAALLFTYNQYALSIAAAILLYLSSVLDCVDGEIARARKLESRTGALLDYTLDKPVHIFNYSAITYALFTAGYNERTIILLGGFVIVSELVLSDIGQRIDALKSQANIKQSGGAKSYFYYNGTANVMILLAASVLNHLFDGMILIGILTFTYATARFIEAYLTLHKIGGTGLLDYTTKKWLKKSSTRKNK